MTENPIEALQSAARAALGASYRLEGIVAGLLDAEEPSLQALSAAQWIDEAAREIRRHALWLRGEGELRTMTDSPVEPGANPG